jgi:D-alanyl-D-alanine carboxypeptidase
VRVLPFGFLSAIGLITACSSGHSSSASAPASSADAGEREADAAEAPARSAECEAQDVTLKKAVDGARESPSAALAVRTKACGLTVYLSGAVESSPGPSGLWRIGSVTKTFVASVVLELAGEGALSLDDTIDKWFPTFPTGHSIHVRQLLSHTSGIYNYTDDASFESAAASDPKRVWKPEELVDVAAKQPLYFSPGASWHYSNTNFIMLGVIAEAVAQRGIAELVRTRLLEPVGLHATFFDGSEPVTGTMVSGFGSKGADVTSAHDPSWAWAAGAMVATPGDLATWITALVEGKVLPEAQLTEMKTTVATETSSMRYGLGLFELSSKVTAGAGTAYGHNGAIPGFYTQAFVFPDKGLTIVSIVDEDGTDPNDLTLAALEALAPGF